jgi:hypothetical protein
MLVGGHHAMTPDVTRVDGKTGSVLLPYEAQTAQASPGRGLRARLSAQPSPAIRSIA